jgi:uncharacterized protein (TIRG00374 family)
MTPTRRPNWKPNWVRINAALSAALILLGLWLLNRTVGLNTIWDAMQQADGRYILLALGIMTLNGAIKAWRWGLLLVPQGKRPSLPHLFWAIWLGQYVNMVIPFLRLGELGRVYALNQQEPIGKARSLGTVVVEKTLDMLLLILTLALLIPFIILPEIITQSGLILALITAAAIGVLYLLAYRTEWFVRLLHALHSKLGRFLPGRIRHRLLPILIDGLEGVASLRNHRTTALLVFSSALSALTGIITPYILFLAFAMPYSLAQAALIDSALSITTTPPSTPGQLGVFEATVVFFLDLFGQTEPSVNISYALVFHMVVLLPKIVLGSIAAARTDWKWQREINQQPETPPTTP